MTWSEPDRWRLPPLTGPATAAPPPLVQRTGTLIKTDPSGVALVRRDDNGGQVALAAGSWRLLKP